MSKDYFLSHASVDKPFVTEIANAVGASKCFLDSYDIKPGDDLLAKLDYGLDATKVFVLFWSKTAAQSPWVSEEVGQARIRKIRNNNIRILPVRLDDTPMPLWMQRLVYLDAKIGAQAIADKISSLAIDATNDNVTADSPFQNRDSEGDAIERAYLDESVSGVVITGLPGMGKTSLCRHFLKVSLPQLRLCWVDIAGGATAATIFGQIAHHFGLRIPLAIIENGAWTRYWREWVEPVLNRTTDTVVLDGASEIVDQDGKLPAWLDETIVSLTRAPAPNCLPLVITSSKGLILSGHADAATKEIYLTKLQDQDIVRALRGMLVRGFPRRHATEAQLRTAAQLVDGYPLGAQIWVSHAIKVGIDLALSDPAPVHKQVLALVHDMLSRVPLSEEERSTLLVLSLSRLPLSINSLINLLAINPASLTSLRNTLLVEITEAGAVIHSLLRRYIADSASRDAVRKAHEQLGIYFKGRWRDAPEEFAESAIYGSQAYFHFLSAGRLAEADTIKWALNQEAAAAFKSLYQARDDELIIKLGEHMLETLGTEIDTQALFYLGLAYSRRHDDSEDRQKSIQMFAELLRRQPENRFYWSGLGDVYQRFGLVDDAKKSFRHARSLSKHRDPVPSMKLGEILLREGNVQEAETFLTEAYERAPDDPRVLAAYALLLQQKGDKAKALGFVREALQKRPNDVHLNHRAGAILRGMGERNEAVNHFRRAAVGREARAAYTSLADLYIDLHRLSAAKEVMEQYPGPKDAAYHNVMGNLARCEERFRDAEQHYDSARRAEGVTVILCGSLMNLRMDQAKRALDASAIEAARAYLSDAEIEYRRGIALEPGNPALLELKNTFDKLQLIVADLKNKLR